MAEVNAVEKQPVTQEYLKKWTPIGVRQTILEQHSYIYWTTRYYAIR